ncbi:hypothetical protein [Paracoccus sp. SSJ]|uniref:hypothetical protein n=1 Tax=Paracoccus sp. SSJ TaxID=3050636 RepID=UPI0025502113|nr:hypothetical protein [Paracoccus sp. SSJ]MDK8874369.1 hypothetical protein [Paracoccus sp. SSJ]
MNRAAILARETLAEAAQYLPGSPDHEYRLCAAWKQAQIAAGIAACDWTEPPADFGPDYFNDNRRAA